MKEEININYLKCQEEQRIRTMNLVKEFHHGAREDTFSTILKQVTYLSKQMLINKDRTDEIRLREISKQIFEGRLVAIRQNNSNLLADVNKYLFEIERLKIKIFKKKLKIKI